MYPKTPIQFEQKLERPVLLTGATKFNTPSAVTLGVLFCIPTKLGGSVKSKVRKYIADVYKAAKAAKVLLAVYKNLKDLFF